MRIFTFFLIIFLFEKPLFAQFFISGYVYDKLTNEPLIGASVFDTISRSGVSSNEFGYYRIKVNANSTIIISYIGYRDLIYHFDNESRGIKNLYLEPTIDLHEIVISDSSGSINVPKPGIINIPIEKLKAIPSVGGEKDILKAVSILPGMSNGSEGSSSLLVRGGGQDQNLFVLDGAPVYNTGHLLNFISIFNPDALKKVDFYKGGFPARYGGRLSSVVDVHFKDGAKNKHGGLFDIGLINSKLLLEGPIGKSQKTSYLFAGRSTYLDFIQSLAGSSVRKVKTFRKNEFNGYTFYDLNFKLNHQWNQRQKIFLSYYEGWDRLRRIENVSEIDDTKIAVINRSFSLKYFHILNYTTSFNVLANFTQNKGKNYHNIQSENSFNSPGENSRIQFLNSKENTLNDNSLFFQFDKSINNNYFIRAGVHSTFHTYKPNFSRQYVNETLISNDSIKFESDINYTSPVLYVPEINAFMEHDFSLFKKIHANVGLRSSTFLSKGTNYSGIEPRVSVESNFGNDIKVFGTYSRTYQYSHALQSNEIGFERLIWVPSGKSLKPQASDLYSLGFSKSLPRSGIDFSMEAYYKNFRGLSQFVFYYDYGDNIYQNWDKNLLKNGIGNSKGIEFLLNKSTGRFTGLLSYTLSKTIRQFEGFNNGKEFPFKYDRRNILNVFGNYQVNKHWKVNFLFNYSTGFKFTPPTGKISNIPFLENGSIFKNEYYLYENVNSGKMPDYHRLDLNASHEKIRVDGKLRTWSINIYNVYNRLNPLFIYIKKSNTFGNPPVITPTQVKAISILPIVPSINYSLKF